MQESKQMINQSSNSVPAAWGFNLLGCFLAVTLVAWSDCSQPIWGQAPPADLPFHGPARKIEWVAAPLGRQFEQLRAWAVGRQEGVPPVAQVAEERAMLQDEEKKQEDAKENQEPLVEATKVEAVKIGPRQIRLQLWDGSIVMGDVSVDSIHIETRFGKLEVPIANILEFRPGLSSVPELDNQINALVEKLGDREFQTRESARLALAAMGPMIRNRLREFSDGGSAERKKHLATLLDELNQMVEDGQENGEGIEAPIDLEDTVSTGEFTIVGRIVEKQYQLSTRYGQLNLDLQHIRRADRSWNQSSEAIRKTVEVGADQFFQRTPASTRILVKAGDKISIRASGSVAWMSWGNISSGPDGIAQQGEWNGAQCGTLMARIGKSGEFIKVGSKNDFVAKSAGELFLGIAMQDHLATQEGYQWGGNYRVKVTVEGGSENP